MSWGDLKNVVGNAFESATNFANKVVDGVKGKVQEIKEDGVTAALVTQKAKATDRIGIPLKSTFAGMCKSAFKVAGIAIRQSYHALGMELTSGKLKETHKAYVDKLEGKLDTAEKELKNSVTAHKIHIGLLEKGKKLNKAGEEMIKMGNALGLEDVVHELLIEKKK